MSPERPSPERQESTPRFPCSAVRSPITGCAPVLTGMLVVMVGTAVTVEALDADGHFLGGIILPALIGNIIGGSLMVGAVYRFIYLRKAR